MGGGGREQGPHVLRLSFKESGGYQFFELVQEMKDRLAASGGGNAALEPLRTFFLSPHLARLG